MSDKISSSQVDAFSEVSVFLFGDVMVDRYVMGNVERVSPEAPVPVLHVSEKQQRLGGAGNVAVNLLALGASVRVCGWTGEDVAGKWLRETLSECGADVTYLFASDSLSTTVKTRFASNNQQLLRVDEEQAFEYSSAMRNRLEECAPGFFESIDVLVISDYAKGAVESEVCKHLISAARSRGIPIIIDPKGTDYSKYAGATIVTPNISELEQVSGGQLCEVDDLHAASSKLVAEHGFDSLALTMSEDGIGLTKQDGTFLHFPARKREVVDVSGAGDTVVALLALGQGSGLSLESCCILANIAASIVCQKFGTAPASARELSNVLDEQDSGKFVKVEEATRIVAELHQNGKQVVFTNGCFDLLHAGHISSFIQARDFGDVLIVAVNSDASVKRIKGPRRPIISERNRIRMVGSLSCVDYVVLMTDDNPRGLISQLKPDVVVKGKDWEGKYMPEAEAVNSYGGRMQFIDLESNLSTTNVINRILEAYQQ
jgi:D-beta-D-heptose 7-phosphate kinase/D-beta-D-heptose 1-phosphate adenosyltransferase